VPVRTSTCWSQQSKILHSRYQYRVKVPTGTRTSTGTATLYRTVYGMAQVELREFVSERNCWKSIYCNFVLLSCYAVYDFCSNLIFLCIVVIFLPHKMILGIEYQVLVPVQVPVRIPVKTIVVLAVSGRVPLPYRKYKPNHYDNTISPKSARK
jgi:hypothetical protein